MQQLSSKIVNKAVASFSSLPGIGEKTALRLVLHLLRKDKEDIVSFASSIEQLLDLHYCSKCSRCTPHVWQTHIAKAEACYNA